MPIQTLSGPGYLAAGLRLILSPGLRRFVLLPLTVNLLLFVALIVLAVQQFGFWVEALMPTLPQWLAFLEYLVAAVRGAGAADPVLRLHPAGQPDRRNWSSTASSPRRSRRWCAAATSRRRSAGASCWR